MIKRCFLFILLMLAFSSLYAQKIEKDTSSIILTAKQDAKKFRFNKEDKKGTIKNLHNENSDYFKPTAMYASQRSLLNDSLYVKTFKFYAIKTTRSRRTTKTLLFIGGGVLVLFALVIAAAVSAGPGLTN